MFDIRSAVSPFALFPFAPLLVLAVCLICSADEPAATLPAEIAHLQDLANQETALVDAARKFDKEQTALAEAELKLTEAAAKAGQKDQAEEKQRQAKHRFELVRQAYEFVLKRYNNDARAQNYYGEVLYDRFGEFDAALKAWHLAAELDPKLGAPRNNLGIHFCHVGEYEQGLQYYDEAIKLEPDNPDYLYNLSQTYLLNFPQVGKIRKWDKARVYREAMKLSKKAARLDTADFELVKDYALNFFEAQSFGVKANWSDAAKAWQRAREAARTGPERFNAWLNEARAWINGSNPAKARPCLEEALKLQPDSAVTKQLLEGLPQKSAPNHPKGRTKGQPE